MQVYKRGSSHTSIRMHRRSSIDSVFKKTQSILRKISSYAAQTHTLYVLRLGKRKGRQYQEE